MDFSISIELSINLFTHKQKNTKYYIKQTQTRIHNYLILISIIDTKLCFINCKKENQRINQVLRTNLVVRSTESGNFSYIYGVLKKF